MNGPQRSVVAALALLVSASALGADLTIKNTNVAGEGFNDSTAVAPQGLNFGTTRGQQALIVFNTAAALWGAAIRSPVPIVIDSAFVSADQDPRFACTSQGTVLGYARLTSYQTSVTFPNPQAGYVAALANALAGQDLTPGEPHIEARFNSGLGTPACADLAWSFALDGTVAASEISLVTTLLHEFGHGLGFASFADPASGSFGSDAPSIFDFHIFDVDAGSTWALETAAQRRTLAVTPRSIGFDGVAVRADMPRFLGYPPSLGFTPPGTTAPSVAFVIGQFSGPVTAQTGPVALASPLDACTDLAAGSLVGKFALISRGTCNFIDKANRAVAAGAIGVIVFDNVASSTLVKMAGEPSLTIPAVFISQADGQSVQAQVNAGPVTAAFTLDTQLSNTDASQSRVLLYTPATLRPGSSVVHWNTATYPQTLLMEFAIAPDMRLNMDLTPAVMADLGWSVVQGLSVAVVKTLNPRVPAGGDASYVIAVVNRRTTAVDSAVLDLPLPPGTTLVSNQGACSTAFPCTLGRMESGDIRLVVTTVRAPTGASGSFAVTATLAPSSADAADNLTATSTQPVASGGDVRVSVTGPAQLTAGLAAPITATITNAGPGEATDVNVTGAAVGAGGGTLTLFPGFYPSLASGETRTATSSFLVPAGYSGSATFTITATSATLDPNSANNTASTTVSTQPVTPPTTSKSGCSSTGEPATVLGLLGVALSLAFRRRSLAA